MNDLTDQQLLRDYAEHHSDAAFGELVRRHIDAVYSAALRLTGEEQSARDTTQAVFVVLAQKAASLTGHPVLSGWLHTTARNQACKSIRAEARRRICEQEAATMNQLLATGADATWQHIAPHLDDALGELTEADRDALMLRYFEKKSAPEMAGLLGITEEAAQKRVTRAVERLRELFSRRKVTIGTGSLVVLISANAVQSAPIGLAAVITTTALAGAAISTSTVLAATKTIAMTTLQKTLITAALVTTVGAGIFEAHQAAQLREQNQVLQQQQAALAGQLRQLQGERDDATNRLATSAEDSATTKNNNTELLKLRAEVTRLRQASADTSGAQNDARAALVKSWLAREDQLRQSVEQYPARAIPEFKLLSSQQWLDAAMNARFDTDEQLQKNLAELRSTAENNFASQALDAIKKYAATNNGEFPADISRLQPYFSPPMDDAILQRWKVAPGSANPGVGVGDMIITEKAPVDAAVDRQWAIGANGYGSSTYLLGDMSAEIATLKPVLKAYTADHGGAGPSDPSQVLPYLTTPEQQAAYQKLMKNNPQNSATH